MTMFSAKVRTRNGKEEPRVIEAESRYDAANALKNEGLSVIDLKERKKGANLGQTDILARFRGVKRYDVMVFTRQLASMVGSGLTIIRALEILAEQAPTPTFKEKLHELVADVEAGSDLSTAMRRRPGIFPRTYVQLVKAGEQSGELDTMLRRVATQLEAEQELKRKITSAMIYPGVVLAFAIVTAIVMLVFIVPVFAKMFESLGGELPLPTRIAMGMSDIVTSVWGILLAIGITLAAVWFLKWKKTEAGRKFVDPKLLKIPMRIGQVIQKIALARFARTFATLAGAGVPILDAIETTAIASGNWVYEKALMDSRDAVSRGQEIHKPLAASNVFPPVVTRMVEIGEEAGTIPEMLDKVAEFYEQEVDATLKALTSIIEPLMIVLVGGIVGGLIIAMYMPMFSVFDLVE